MNVFHLLATALAPALAAAAHTVHHAEFPEHRLTVNDPAGLGIDRVKQSSGYMEVRRDAKLFYWFFESRRSPATDPVVLWLNGGPGCSSLEGLLFENGPASIDSQGRPVANPHSWNEVANVIFLDQPVGTGFSTGGERVATTPQAAVDVDAFVHLFFQQFPQYAHSGFHIAGESYARRYIPVFANQINSNPSRPVAVSSVMIGNGVVDPVAEYAAYQPMLCGQGGYPQKLSNAQCSAMAQQLPACLSAIRGCMQRPGMCAAVDFSCYGQESTWQRLNPYDIRDARCAPAADGLCYPQMDSIATFLNQPAVQQQLGVAGLNFQDCNDDVNARFNARHDSLTDTPRNVTALLEQGVPVLAYYGDKDIICNWLGGRQWTSALAWSGAAGFKAAAQAPQPWSVGGRPAGTVTHHDKFTFLRVFDAGHMVPHDQPAAALAMLTSWLEGDRAFGTGN